MSAPIEMAEFADWMVHTQSAGTLPKTPFDWAVAVSGGADSVALAHLLHAWHTQHQPGARCVALTVDHGLRPESAQEAAQVGVWMHARGMPHVVLKWDAPSKPETRVQEAARNARYDLMADWCAAQNIPHLFLAHHQDDQIETFMLRLFRASGLDGLGGMRPSRSLTTAHGTLTLHRPLLHVGHARLCTTLEALDQPWIEDPSNQNPRFERIRIRNMLEPFAPHKDAITESMRKLQQAEDALAWCSTKILKEIGGKTTDPTSWTLDKQAFSALPDALQQRLLRQILEDLAPRAYPIRTLRIQNLMGRLQKGTPLPRCTLGGCLISEKNGQIFFRVEGVSKR